jgi:hypothetical protein
VIHTPCFQRALLSSRDQFSWGPSKRSSRSPNWYDPCARTGSRTTGDGSTGSSASPTWLPSPIPCWRPFRTWTYWTPGRTHRRTTPDFHATHDATRREYVYHLHAPAETVDDERATAALDALRGEHDFHNLTPDDDGTVRGLDGEIDRDGEYLVVRVQADGFARQLVRRLVALLDEIARGERDLGAVDRVLAAEPVPGPAGVPAAPAEPLVLADVTYPNLAFERDPEAAASTREIFRERRVRHATRARVAEDLIAGVGGTTEEDG